MKTIHFHIEPHTDTKYRELAEHPQVRLELEKIRPNAGKAELMRRALELAYPLLKDQLLSS